MIWKEVGGFPGYFVSDTGLIRTTKRNRDQLLVLMPNPGGYLRVKLSGSSGSVPQLVHRVVALNFIPNPEGKRDVNHKDGVKTNNNATNLEWATQKENLHHAMRNGMHANPFIAIQCLETGEVFESLTAAANKLGVYQENITRVLSGERTHTGGFTFKKVG